MAHHVFICHSSHDQGVATAVCDRLEARAIGCWIAPRDPVPGLPYSEQIVRAIAESAIVLLVFSAHANASRAVLGEIELAANRSKIILPVRIEDVALSESLEYYIRSVHWHDAIAPRREEQLDALAARVESLLGTQSPKMAHPGAAPAAAAAPAISAADLAAVTAQLAAYVGPIARVLVARYASSATNFAALCDALGAEIADPEERRRFRAGTAR